MPARRASALIRRVRPFRLGARREEEIGVETPLHVTCFEPYVWSPKSVTMHSR
jgi:hypothetical protein